MIGMAEIRVWAPAAHLVELDCGGLVGAMRRDEAGWWMSDAPSIQHGTDYAFRVDGEGPFPDPRSPWQPNGVHASSRWVDHARFDWTDAGWRQPPLASAVIYEAHVGTFTPEGTFDSAVDRLDHLVDLGVTHLELMPVAEFPGRRGWGYEGVDLFAPHHAYGGPDALKRLVNECHARGLGVIIDVVYSHLGPCGNYLARFGPYFSDRYRTPWGAAVNFDGPGSDEVRCFCMGNAVMWLRDYHADGLRIDAVHAIFDTSAIHILEQLGIEVDALEAALGRNLVLIAESDLNDPRVIRSREAGGYGLDAQWNEDFHNALHAVLTGERDRYYADFGRLADFAKVLTDGFAYDGRYSVYRGRSHGRPATGLPGDRFVGCLQNHDHVGNRALGERASNLMPTGLLKAGSALVMTSPFVPMLFQGEEWGASTPFLFFTDRRASGGCDGIKDGRREEFAALGYAPESIPDPEDETTFRRSVLDWSEPQREPHGEILRWHRSLIALRRTLAELRDGRMDCASVRLDEADRWLVMKRGTVLVACNFSDEPRRIPCPESAGGEFVLSSKEGAAMDGGALMLPAESVAVLCRAARISNWRGDEGAGG
jgi:maltooligosyltrehalose trehalohydrolase